MTIHRTITYAKDNAPMVLVPEGTFLMGALESDFLAADDCKPQREIWLSGFWIDVHPVTNSQFATFIADGGYSREDLWTPEGWTWRTHETIEGPAIWQQSGWDDPEQPVAGVSWYEAAAYARWAGKRLPTDAEWEKAARGVDGRAYPWGNGWPTCKRCNFDNHVGRTTVVGSYPDGVSPFGCHDMSGNVNNWCFDWYWPGFQRLCATIGRNRDPHLTDQLAKALKPQPKERIDRGGGFATTRASQEVLGCVTKLHWKPNDREKWHGFRTALTAAPSVATR